MKALVDALNRNIVAMENSPNINCFSANKRTEKESYWSWITRKVEASDTNGGLAVVLVTQIKIGFLKDRKPVWNRISWLQNPVYVEVIHLWDPHLDLEGNC